MNAAICRGLGLPHGEPNVVCLYDWRHPDGYHLWMHPWLDGCFRRYVDDSFYLRHVCCGSLSTLIGIYVGGISGGLISACLLKIPGTSASLVTTWDGYPMVKRGKPEAALSLGVFASLIGGTFSAIVLATIAPQLSKVTLSSGIGSILH